MGWFGRAKATGLSAAQISARDGAIAGCRLSRKYTEIQVVPTGGSAYAYADGDVIRWAVLAPGNVKVAEGIEVLESRRIAAE